MNSFLSETLPLCNWWKNANMCSFFPYFDAHEELMLWERFIQQTDCLLLSILFRESFYVRYNGCLFYTTGLLSQLPLHFSASFFWHKPKGRFYQVSY